MLQYLCKGVSKVTREVPVDHLTSPLFEDHLLRPLNELMAAHNPMPATGGPVPHENFVLA